MAILIALANSTWAEPTPLQNGDFLVDIRYIEEEGANEGNWLGTVKPSGTPQELASVEWFVLPDDQDIVFRMEDMAPDGTVGQLEQLVNLEAGSYRLNFTFSATMAQAESDWFYVFADDRERDVVTNEGAPVSVLDQTGYFDFDTSGGDVLLGFRLVREGAAEVGSAASIITLDCVGLSVVPVPGAVLLGSVGLGCAGMRLRRLRQRMPL